MRYHAQQRVRRGCRASHHTSSASLALGCAQRPSAPLLLAPQHLLVRRTPERRPLALAHQLFALLGLHGADEQHLDRGVLHVPRAQHRLKQVAKVAARAVKSDEHAADVEWCTVIIGAGQVDAAADDGGEHDGAEVRPPRAWVGEVAEALGHIGISVIELVGHALRLETRGHLLPADRLGAHRKQDELRVVGLPRRHGALELLPEQLRLRLVRAEVDAQAAVQVHRHVGRVERHAQHIAARRHQV